MEAIILTNPSKTMSAAIYGLPLSKLKLLAEFRANIINSVSKRYKTLYANDERTLQNKILKLGVSAYKITDAQYEQEIKNYFEI